MNTKKVRRRVGVVLDHVLLNDLVQRDKEPSLPKEREDRTEWLLWCCNRLNCSMDEANRKYWSQLGQQTFLGKRRKLKR